MDRQTQSDLLTLLDLPEGRRFIARFVSDCGVLRSAWTGDALSSAHAEGRRAAGLALLDAVRAHAPVHHAAILKELVP